MYRSHLIPLLATLLTIAPHIASLNAAAQSGVKPACSLSDILEQRVIAPSEEQKELSQKLFAAIENGDVEEVMAILAAGVDLRVLDENGTVYIERLTAHGRTHLHKAVWFGHIEIAYVLCEVARHEKIDDYVSLGRFCYLPETSIYGYVSRLIQCSRACIRGEKIRPVLSAAPIHNAAIRGNSEMVELLLAYGEDVNRPDYAHITPLHFAVRFDCIDVVKLLCEKGGNLDATDGIGFLTPEQTAKHYSAQDCLAYLQSHSPAHGS